jgi:tetratricopeptide (TPR) repeat protein
MARPPPPPKGPARPPDEDEPLGTPEPSPAGDQAWEDLTPAFEAAERAAGRRGPPAPGPARPRGLLLAVAASVAVVLLGGLLAYRAHHQRRAVREGLARALPLLAQDSAASYREAADLLEPLGRIDELEVASVRAFALAMRFADHRDAEAEALAEALLVGPSREEEVPVWAILAQTALAFGRREAGDATTLASRAGDHPVASLLLARTALAAGNATAALEYASAAAEADRGLAGAQALLGDLVRRFRRDPSRAREAYEAALAISPRHPRAAYGLAKLALSGQAPAGRAAPPLRDLLADREGTPAAERGRAALHLAALLLRAGDASGATAVLDEAGLEPRDRAWAARAAEVAAAARGPYRAVVGAPPALRSASDDDPPVAPLAAPAPPPRPATKAPARPKKKASARRR